MQRLSGNTLYLVFLVLLFLWLLQGENHAATFVSYTIDGEQHDALILLAPVGREVQEVSERLHSIQAPVLLLVEASDQPGVLANFKQLAHGLRDSQKEVTSIVYDRGGAHRLFYDVSYYWEDLRRFLREKLRGP